MKRNKRWTRRNELLAILPAAQPMVPPPRLGVWGHLLCALARDWRIFTAYAPKPGVKLPVGGTGVDPISLDTLPMMRRVLAEQLVSGVLLVGQADVLEHMEVLHSYAPHVPFVAALSGPGRMDLEHLEFQLGWSDRVLFSEAPFMKRLKPALDRLGVPAQVAPLPRRKELWKPFVDGLTGHIQDAFLKINRKSMPTAEAVVDWVAFLSETSKPRWGDALAEWKSCLPGRRGAILLPRAARAEWESRVRRHWPGAALLTYRDEEHAVARANEALARARRPYSLLVNAWARLSPMCVGRLLGASVHHPLSAAVCGETILRETEDFRQWSAFCHAWEMRLRGGCRHVREISPHCLLLDRGVVESSGFLDPRLGWKFGVLDLGLRIRQNGWAVFRAEDVVVSIVAPEDGIEPGPEEERFKTVFSRKWTLDPWAVLNGSSRRLRR